LFKNRHIAVGAAAAAIGGVGMSAVASSADAGTAHKASAAALNVASVNVSGHGKHQLLVTSSGRAVYLLTGDSATHALCASSGCLTNWPAVTSSAKKPTLGSGIKGKLAVWNHGKIHQLTLNGHPLYTFAADASANSAKGQGIKASGHTWELLTASGAGYTLTSSTSSSGSAGSGSPSGSWS
jgi:predicted lipoprotein with Yx(FWY)xxD motif